MARKFITSKEHSFIARINKELIQNFTGQEVIYYPLSREDTQVNNIYGESVEKVWLPPVRLNCRVAYDNPTVKSMEYGLDSDYTLEVYALNDELIERNLVPREGDFVEFGQVYFEVTGVTEPQLVFGQVNNKLMKRLACVAAREGQFAAGGYSTGEVVDNSHPVQTPASKNVRD